MKLKITISVVVCLLFISGIVCAQNDDSIYMASDNILYKINSQTGEIIYKVVLNNNIKITDILHLTQSVNTTSNYYNNYTNISVNVSDLDLNASIQINESQVNNLLSDLNNISNIDLYQNSTDNHIQAVLNYFNDTNAHQTALNDYFNGSDNHILAVLDTLNLTNSHQILLNNYFNNTNAHQTALNDYFNATDDHLSAVNVAQNLTHGYVLQVGSGGTFSPADLTNYYFDSNFGSIPQTTDGIARLYIPANGTVRSAVIYWYSAGTQGTAENVIEYMRYQGTNTTISGNATAYVEKTFINYNLNIPVERGNYIQLTIQTPAWVTNPTNVVQSGTIFISAI
jgi:hypothetical protein